VFDVQVAGAAWQAAMRIMAGVGDLVQRTGDGQAQVGYSVAMVCNVHKEMSSVGFLVWPQNHGLRFVSGLASKPLGWVSRFMPQNRLLRFDNLGLKITVTVSWFEPQNQAGYGLLVAPQNRWEDEDSAGHASRSSGLLCVKASRARVS
jgi:hypothetical protein